MKLIQRGGTSDISKHNIGKSPNQTVLNTARANLLHHITYNRCRELLNYSGTLDWRYDSPNEINGDYSCSFYVVYPTRGSSGDNVRIGYSLTTWDNSTAGDCDFQFDGVDSARLPSSTVPASSGQTGSYGMSQTGAPNGVRVEDYKTLGFANGSFGGFSYTKVSFQNMQPASFVSWIMSESEADYNAIDESTYDQAYNIGESMFNIGQQLRGSNAIADGNGSVGTLCQRQFSDSTLDQNMVSNSDVCLFQWGHPAGAYVIGGGAGLNDQDVFGYKIKIKGRELLSSGSGKFNVALVYRADTSTTFKILVDSTATTHSLGLTGSSSVVTQQVLSDIPFDGNGDELTIYCTVSNSEAVEIKTIAIFESTY